MFFEQLRCELSIVLRCSQVQQLLDHNAREALSKAEKRATAAVTPNAEARQHVRQHVQRLYTSVSSADELMALREAQALRLEASCAALAMAQDDLAQASAEVGALRGKAHSLEDVASGLDVRG